MGEKLSVIQCRGVPWFETEGYSSAEIKKARMEGSFQGFNE